jgi:aryl-alcohol dehydrogenase-like predicted oxidoreductase
LQGINEYDFDCIMLTLNAGDPYYQPFQEDLLQTAVAKNMGIIAMKVAAYGRIFREGGITTMKDAMGYVLSFPVSTAVVGISNLAELEENASIAASFKPLAAEELHRLERLVEPYQQEVNFFKTRW